MHLVHGLILALFLLSAGTTMAQEKGSLTDEFKGMSAKERSRIAKQEIADAQQDLVFQGSMARADSLARARQHELALEEYRKARGMRPYNVLPKVRIQDLEVLIAKQAAERSEVADDTTGSAVPPAPEPREVPRNVVVPVEKTRPVQREASPVNVAPRSPDPEPEVSDVPADGMVERNYREGRAIVTERTLVTEGKAVVYKRVGHPWGEVYYFKDGEAVPERIWKETFWGQ